MPEDNTAKSQNWKIGDPSNSYKKWFRQHPNHTVYIKEFQKDVTANPYHHPTLKKIFPVRDKHNYPPGCYRWRKKDLRIVYFPSKPDHTVYPLDANSESGIGYK